MPTPKQDIKTLTVDNFTGNLTRFRTGDINSGKAYQDTSWGYTSFALPPALTFNQSPISIGGAVVTDLIVAGKCRIESGITYTYAIGHTGRLYKIQVNNPVTFNPDYDNPVLLATLSNGQTFNYGASLDFYQSATSEKIWIGTDQGMTKINFDGTGETVIGTTDSTHWVFAVPRVQRQEVGKIYVTNGSNLAEIDSSETVTTYTKINPGFPANYQARDLDSTADGRYVVITITRSPAGSILTTTPDLNNTVSDSIIAYWNGTDPAVSSFNSTPNFVQTCYHTFGQNEYIFGYDITGAIISNPNKKLFFLPWAVAPSTNAVSSTGDFVGWCQVEGANGNNTTNATANFMIYGNIDIESPVGLYRQIRLTSSLTNGDIIRVPFMQLVSTEQFAGPTSGYALTPFGNYNIATGKTYFSTLEFDGVTTAYKLYSFKNALDLLSAVCTGNYDTQIEIMSQKTTIPEYRVYTDPSAGNESFTVSILGSNGLPLSGTTQTFTANPGDDRFKYNPSMLPTQAIGLRVTNVTGLPIIHKVEIDYTHAGN